MVQECTKILAEAIDKEFSEEESAMKQISVSELVEKINSGAIMTEANAEEQKNEGEGDAAAPDQAAKEEEKKEGEGDAAAPDQPAQEEEKKEEQAASDEAKDAEKSKAQEVKEEEKAPDSNQKVEIKIQNIMEHVKDTHLD